MIGGNEEKIYSSVVFILYKSASVDVKNETKNMFYKLLIQANKGNIIRIGVVVFNKNAID